MVIKGNKTKYYRLILSILGSILSVFGVVKLQSQQLTVMSSVQNKENYFKQEKQRKIQINLQKKMPTFGFDNLLADFNYLQFIQYFGDGEVRNVTGYSLVTDYFETIVAQDHNFIYAHLFLASANSLFAARPEKTVELLDKVIAASSPESPGYPFFLWTYKATDEILFLGDLKAAQNSYLMAAEWASMRNDDLGDELSERYLTTAKFLASNPDSTATEIGAWAGILSQTNDLKTQNYVLKRLKELGAEVNISPDGKFDIKPPKSNQA